MAAPTTQFDRQLRELEAEMKRLEVEYNLFFAGRLPKLPWDTRARVESLIKQYDRMHIQNTAERFRFQGLQARFSSFCELWERHLKSREGGRPGVRGRAGGAASPPVSAPTPPVRSQSPGPEVVTLRDPGDAESVRQLHERLNEARRGTGEAEVPFDRFQEVVRAQFSKLSKDGAKVDFKVGAKDGRVTFTAKPTSGADDDADE
ncbi:MAG: MXAN_5187 C-terminal domain-containing protein [Vicinamibacterales bacterium]